jgi:phosphoenolpyruvate---glycerone phosphotransferase subunit DhaK
MVGAVPALIRSDIEDGKVALLIGGGSGHEPMYTFLVGRDLRTSRLPA